MTRIVAISDTHGLHERVVNGEVKKLEIPDGDMLLCAGDITNNEGRASLRSFLKWFESQPHKFKAFIAGNHDFAYQKWPDLARAMTKEIAPNCVYLEDSSCELGGLKIHGSPWTPFFLNWAFNAERGDDIKRHWDMIPEGTDVLLTHGPPHGYLDMTNHINIATGKKFGDHLGCQDLLDAIKRIRPKLHVFGHIHGGYGTTKLTHDDGSSTTLINASVVNEGYEPVNKPWITFL